MKAALAAQAPVLIVILVIGLLSTQYTILRVRKIPRFSHVLFSFLFSFLLCRFLLMTVPAIRESLALKQKAAEEKIKTIDVSFIFSVIPPPPPPPFFFFFFFFSLRLLCLILKMTFCDVTS